jgi:hypothetical protein
MENVTSEIKSESLKSLQSSIRKTEKSLEQMRQKAANTTLIESRLLALRVGLNVFESVWSGENLPFNQDELAKARGILAGLLPSIGDIYRKTESGTPQRTLLKRRIKALELAVEAIDGLTAGEA